jgi:tRNA modification GTPase
LSGGFKPTHLYLGYFSDPAFGGVDEVIINCIPENKSFTGMETIEINSHGGMMPARKIIGCLIKQGAKEINQKELMELAVRHNRLNPIQKEALESLLHSPTALASRVFMDQFNGTLSKAINKLLFNDKTCNTRLLNKLIKSASLGFALNYPKRILIVGRPNTGKSTLFNTLAGQERVIVHHLPGTTRDVIEEIIAINEIPFILVDTAGWRKIDKITHPQSLIEKIGIRKMKAEIKKADIIICLLDGSRELIEFDKEIIHKIEPYQTIWVINKSDLTVKMDDSLLPESPLFISALKQKGIEKLREEISLRAKVKNLIYKQDQPVIFTRRQYKLIEKSRYIGIPFAGINNASGRSRHS